MSVVTKVMLAVGVLGFAPPSARVTAADAPPAGAEVLTRGPTALFGARVDVPRSVSDASVSPGPALTALQATGLGRAPGTLPEGAGAILPRFAEARAAQAATGASTDALGADAGPAFALGFEAAPASPGLAISAAASARESAGAGALPWMALWRGNEIQELEAPVWIEHIVRPGERLSTIAVRYGVSADALRRWNPSVSRRLRRDQVLRIHTDHVPPPLVSVTHRVREGETWRDIGVAYRVDPFDLAAQNGGYSTALTEGRELVVWVDPALPWTLGEGARRSGQVYAGTPQAPLIAAGGLSVGTPNKGKLLRGVQLPESDLYTRRLPDVAWGSSHTLTALTSAIHRMRLETGYAGPIMIGSISRHGGGRFPPHRSHQSGRDIDIRLPTVPSFKAAWRGPRPDEVDWMATWTLIDYLFATQQVDVIFLSYPLQHRLYDAARSLGETDEYLSTRIQWAGAREWGQPAVRHEHGHDGHIHVRFGCGPEESRCHRH